MGAPTHWRRGHPRTAPIIADHVQVIRDGARRTNGFPSRDHPEIVDFGYGPIGPIVPHHPPEGTRLAVGKPPQADHEPRLTRPLIMR